jgi:aminomethyltransferase
MGNPSASGGGNVTESRPGGFKGTPFSDRTIALNRSGRWAAWNQYHLPEVFAEHGYDTEVRAMRQTAILEDKTPLIKTLISGRDALPLVNRLIPRKASTMDVLHAIYTPMCDERGKLIMDGVLFRVEENAFVFTGGRIDRWLAKQAAGLEVRISDSTEAVAILHLQGPLSLEILDEATRQEWSDLRFSRGRKAAIAGVHVHVWRQGFTGERGFEIWVPPERAIPVWDTLWEAGEPRGLSPCGHNTQDVGRIEAGLILPAIDYTCAGPDTAARAHAYGAEASEFEASPYELGLGRFVDLRKDDFIGRAALAEEGGQGRCPRRLVGLEIDWRQIVRLFDEAGRPPEITRRVHRFPALQVSLSDRPVGFASSITWSPTLKKEIGFGRVAVEAAETGTPLSLRWEVAGLDGQVDAVVVALPFVGHRRAS